MFYDRFCELCKQKNVKPGRACVEMGVSRGLAAKWKATKTEKPSADVLEKMSIYFNKSINEILFEAKKAPTQEGERQLEQQVQDIYISMSEFPPERREAMEFILKADDEKFSRAMAALKILLDL